MSLIDLIKSVLRTRTLRHLLLPSRPNSPLMKPGLNSIDPDFSSKIYNLYILLLLFKSSHYYFNWVITTALFRIHIVLYIVLMLNIITMVSCSVSSSVSRKEATGCPKLPGFKSSSNSRLLKLKVVYLLEKRSSVTGTSSMEFVLRSCQVKKLI